MATITEITTKAEFETEVTGYAGTVLVDFWAPWCGPCKMITPVVDALAEEYAGKIKVVKVNVDEGGDLAGEMDVMGVPSLLFFVGGKEVQRIVGNHPDKLKDTFAQLAK